SSAGRRKRSRWTSKRPSARFRLRRRRKRKRPATPDGAPAASFPGSELRCSRYAAATQPSSVDQAELACPFDDALRLVDNRIVDEMAADLDGGGPFRFRFAERLDDFHAPGD